MLGHKQGELVVVWQLHGQLQIGQRDVAHADSAPIIRTESVAQGRRGLLVLVRLVVIQSC